MADEKQSGQELRGLLLAVIAGVLVVALAFGVSAIVRHAMPQSAQSTENTQTPANVASANYTPQMISDGGKIYLQACASCHGANAKGSIGPSLHNLRASDERITRVIKNGKGQMPAFGNQFNDTQIGDIVGYLRSLK